MTTWFCTTIYSDNKVSLTGGPSCPNKTKLKLFLENFSEKYISHSPLSSQRGEKVQREN